MFRPTSNSALNEAHVQAERARHELDAAIRDAFASFGELERRLRVFEGTLEQSRALLRQAGYLGNDSFRPDFGAGSTGPTARMLRRRFPLAGARKAVTLPGLRQ